MLLYGPNGINYAQHQTLPLTAHSVLWFMEGRQLLQHAGDLRTARARLVCKICLSGGGDCDVHVANRTAGEVFVACPHHPKGGRVSLVKPLDIGSLLLALGWNLVCSACGEPLQGDNYEGSTNLTVSCSCTTREFHVPAA